MRYGKSDLNCCKTSQLRIQPHLNNTPIFTTTKLNHLVVIIPKGNAFFKKQDYKKAIHFYTKAITLLSPPTTSSPSTSTPPITHDPSNPLIVPLINRALAYIKLERWVEAEVDCTRALAMEGGGGGGNAGGKNVKALVRRGIARRELKRYDEALKGELKGKRCCL